jgi:hypothetical protein
VAEEGVAAEVRNHLRTPQQWLVWFGRTVIEAVTGMGEVAAGAAVEVDIGRNSSDTM